jgi:hypothetical protein
VGLHIMKNIVHIIPINQCLIQILRMPEDLLWQIWQKVELQEINEQKLGKMELNMYYKTPPEQK